MARGRARADGTVVAKGPNYGTALQAIKRHCKQCSGDQKVRNCPCDDCELWPFRAGRGPDVARHSGWAVDPPKRG